MGIPFTHPHRSGGRRQEYERLGFYLGRLEATHAVLDLVAPGQPHFDELMLRMDDPLEHWAAALAAAQRRLGSALSRMDIAQRELLRDAALDLERQKTTRPGLSAGAHADYRLARAMAYREIITALDIRRSGAGWMM